MSSSRLPWDFCSLEGLVRLELSKIQKTDNQFLEPLVDYFTRGFLWVVCAFNINRLSLLLLLVITGKRRYPIYNSRKVVYEIRHSALV